MAWTITLTPGTVGTYNRGYIKGVAIYRQHAVLSTPAPYTIRAEEATFYVDFKFWPHVWEGDSDSVTTLKTFETVTGWNKTINAPYNLSARIRISTPANKRNWYIGLEYTLFYQPAKFYVLPTMPGDYWYKLRPE